MAKRQSLAEQAKQSADKRSSRMSPARPAGTADKPKKEAKRNVQVRGFSLYPEQLAWVEETARSLKKRLPTAGRSFVVQKAVVHLKQQLEGKTPQEIRHFLLEQVGSDDET